MYLINTEIFCFSLNNEVAVADCQFVSGMEIYKPLLCVGVFSNFLIFFLNFFITKVPWEHECLPK